MDRTEYVNQKRAIVIECVEKAIANGWKMVSGMFASDGQVCALGAIGMCQRGMPAPKHDAWEDKKLLTGTDGWTDTEAAYALSRQHLDCTQWELESIEAGFEAGGKPLEHINRVLLTWHKEAYWRGPRRRSECGTPFLGALYDPDFFAIGAEVLAKYGRSESDDDEGDDCPCCVENDEFEDDEAVEEF